MQGSFGVRDPATKRPLRIAVDEDGRPLRAPLCTPVFSGTAPGVAGDRGGDLAGAAPSGATCKPVSSPSGLVHAQREGKKGLRSPGTGKGRRVILAGIAGLTVSREGCKPARGETPWRLDAQRKQPGPAQRGHANTSFCIRGHGILLGALAPPLGSELPSQRTRPGPGHVGPTVACALV